MKGKGDFSAETPEGNNIHFGVREHAMAAICNGIRLHGGLRPYCATFFVFSDYMKNAMRMSAIMGLNVPYILTHDSIGVGEDGPTHQPIEQLAGLRAMPGLTVFRPADSKEVAAGWVAAMTGDTPVALVLTRQDLPLYEKSGADALKGGYILSDCEGTPDVLLMASGSEVEQCMGAQELLKAEGVKARVISMPSFELFEAQSDEYKESVMPVNVRARVAVEGCRHLRLAQVRGPGRRGDRSGSLRRFRPLQAPLPGVRLHRPRTWPRPPRRSSADYAPARLTLTRSSLHVAGRSFCDVTA